MKIALPLLTIALAALAAPAHAQWYAGASLGAARTSSHDGSRLSDQLLDLGFDDASTSVSDSDTAYRVFAGWWVRPWLAVEAGYADLGRRELRASVLPAGSLTANVRTDGGDVSVLGMLPVGSRVGLYGRVGAYAMRSRASYSASGSVALVDGASEPSERRSGGMYGVGAAFEAMPRLTVRLEWTRYARLGNDLTGGRFDADVASLGFAYRF